MLEKWKSSADNKKSFGTLFTNLSKEFDCLAHDPLIEKKMHMSLTCQLLDLYIVILKIVCKEQK